mmetsp:Transcript_50586/g.156552  ORF Transcript_50586/g.156552 Transcript_50586/m.156552 type:complete len:207 (+) Transcript_50586:112-732(+)
MGRRCASRPAGKPRRRHLPSPRPTSTRSPRQLLSPRDMQARTQPPARRPPACPSRPPRRPRTRRARTGSGPQAGYQRRRNPRARRRPLALPALCRTSSETPKRSAAASAGRTWRRTARTTGPCRDRGPASGSRGKAPWGTQTGARFPASTPSRHGAARMAAPAPAATSALGRRPASRRPEPGRRSSCAWRPSRADQGTGHWVQVTK